MPKVVCPDCGGNYPGFHICMKMDKATATEVVLSEEQKAKSQRNRYSGRSIHTPESKKKIGEATRQRHSRARSESKKRDAEIVELYKSGEHTQLDISNQMHVGRDVVNRVLHEAAGRGELVIRPRGKAVRRSVDRPAVQQGIRERQRIENRERDELIIKRYKEEKIGQRELAESMGLSMHVVRRVLLEAVNRGEMTMRQQGANVARHAAHVEKMEKIKQDLLNEYQTTSISLEDLARKYQINRTTASNYLKSCGVEVVTKKQPLKETNPDLYSKIIKLYADRKIPLAAIAKRLDIDVSTISRAANYAIKCGDLTHKRRNLNIENEVFKAYEETTESIQAMAERFNVSQTRILKLVVLGIESGACKPRTTITD